MRDQVQRWLSACVVAGHDTPDGDNAHVAFEVDAPTLEALCRRWLAVEDAPTVLVSEWIWEDVPEELDGQRVRLVPEAGQGGGGVRRRESLWLAGPTNSGTAP